MRDIEKHNPQLAGVLPKTYNIFTSTLLKELLKKVSEIPASLDYDAFGRIYEYFLGEFARTEGQKGGEWDFTGQDETPLSPNDDAHHPKCRRRITVSLLPGRPSRGQVNCFAVRAEARRVTQANAPPFGVTLAGLFATLHRWNALAALPRSRNAPGVLPTFSAQVRTRTGRIKSVLPTLTAPFYCDLAIHPYGSRAL